jgi:hypothetical protein
MDKQTWLFLGSVFGIRRIRSQGENKELQERTIIIGQMLHESFRFQLSKPLVILITHEAKSSIDNSWGAEEI